MFFGESVSQNFTLDHPNPSFMSGTVATPSGSAELPGVIGTWRAIVEKHALPVLGELPVSEVAVEDVLRVLRPIWGITGSLPRGRIETVLVMPVR